MTKRKYAQHSIKVIRTPRRGGDATRLACKLDNGPGFIRFAFAAGGDDRSADFEIVVNRFDMPVLMAHIASAMDLQIKKEFP